MSAVNKFGANKKKKTQPNPALSLAVESKTRPLLIPPPPLDFFPLQLASPETQDTVSTVRESVAPVCTSSPGWMSSFSWCRFPTELTAALYTHLHVFVLVLSGVWATHSSCQTRPGHQALNYPGVLLGWLLSTHHFTHSELYLVFLCWWIWNVPHWKRLHSVLV